MMAMVVNGRGRLFVRPCTVSSHSRWWGGLVGFGSPPWFLNLEQLRGLQSMESPFGGLYGFGVLFLGVFVLIY